MTQHALRSFWSAYVNRALLAVTLLSATITIVNDRPTDFLLMTCVGLCVIAYQLHKSSSCVSRRTETR
jgi:hypothetical protein